MLSEGSLQLEWLIPHAQGILKIIKRLIQSIDAAKVLWPEIKAAKNEGIAYHDLITT